MMPAPRATRYRRIIDAGQFVQPPFLFRYLVGLFLLSFELELRAELKQVSALT